MALKAQPPLSKRPQTGPHEVVAHSRSDITLKPKNVREKGLDSTTPQKDRKQPKWDSRLIGTWKSDRRRTFRNWQPKSGADPKAVLKFKSLFGKMTVRWGREKYHSELGSYRETANYEIVGRDSNSVVIRSWDTIYQEYRLVQIHFEEDCYFIALGAGLSETFRRIS